jgi:hypothetical protein
MDLKQLQRFRNHRGIYCLYNDNEIVYIGSSENLYVRVLEHVAEKAKDFNRVKAFNGKDHSKENNLMAEMGLICEFQPKLNKIKFESFFNWFHSIPIEHDTTLEEISLIISSLSSAIQDMNDDRMVEL